MFSAAPDTCGLTLEDAIYRWQRQPETFSFSAWLTTSLPIQIGMPWTIEFSVFDGFLIDLTKELDAGGTSVEIQNGMYLPLNWPSQYMKEHEPYRERLAQVNYFKTWPYPIEHLLYPARVGIAALHENYPASVERERLIYEASPNMHWWLDPSKRNGITDINEDLDILYTTLFQKGHHSDSGLCIGLCHLHRMMQTNTLENKLHLSPNDHRIFLLAEPGPFALALAWTCDRDAVPKTDWWKTWDSWSVENQFYKNTTFLVYLSYLADLTDASDENIRNKILRLAALRDPPPSFAIAHMMKLKKQYQDTPTDTFVEMVLGPSKTFMLVDGLGVPYREQILHLLDNNLRRILYPGSLEGSSVSLHNLHNLHDDMSM